MIKNIKIILISMIGFVTCSFTFADAAEVKFLGKIVEPACDVLIQKETHCQKIFKDTGMYEIGLNVQSFTSKDQIEQFLNQQTQKTSSMVSVELLNNSDSTHQNIGNLLVKYR
ncbi:hypothetical protein KTH71_01630 [Acinetobacter sp. WU_MDCI_Axc73]|nr:hypothetical protein [Acinetobacter sp. WU_MDCI_Axc73]